MCKTNIKSFFIVLVCFVLFCTHDLFSEEQTPSQILKKSYIKTKKLLDKGNYRHTLDKIFVSGPDSKTSLSIQRVKTDSFEFIKLISRKGDKLIRKLKIINKIGEATVLKELETDWKEKSTKSRELRFVKDKLEKNMPKKERIEYYIENVTEHGEEKIKGRKCKKLSSKIAQEKVNEYTSKLLKKRKTPLANFNIEYKKIGFWIEKKTDILRRNRNVKIKTFNTGTEKSSKKEIKIKETNTFTKIGSAKIKEKYKDIYNNIVKE